MSEEICKHCKLARGNHDALLWQSQLNTHPFEPERVFKVGDAVRTRDGRKARIVCDDLFVSPGEERRLVVLVTVRDGGGGEVAYSYARDGHYKSYEETQDDLVPAPRTRTVWVTWWGRRAEGLGEVTITESFYYSGRSAKKDGALACIKVELEEGRFDE